MRGMFLIDDSTPNGSKINLEEDISIEEKLKVVNGLLSDWDSIFELGWNVNNNRITFFVDGLANYLVWHKELDEKGKEDKEVLSIRKVEEMEGKRRPMSTPFTYLSDSQKEMLGMEERNNE